MLRVLPTQRRIRYFFLLLFLAGVAGVAAYWCLPSLRLSMHAGKIREIPRAQWVNAHRYDQEWFDAARVGRIDILRALYEAHYPIDSQTSAGYTAVILAAYDSQPKALDYLLRIGANPCSGDRHGNTSLMGALYKGHMDIARRLLATRCPIDQVNNAGETALSFAALFGRVEILPELVARGADPNHADARGNTPLAIVLQQGNEVSAMALRKLAVTR
jgi:ankyrin repeat protein